MEVKIKKLTHNTYSVNDKEVIEDFDGRIYCRVDLTISEEKALQDYIMSEKKKVNER